MTTDQIPVIDEEAPDAPPDPRDADTAWLQATILQLKALRIEQGLSQWDVARRVGITQSAISEVERLITGARVSTIQRYARAVGARLRFVIAPPLDQQEPKP